MSDKVNSRAGPDTLVAVDDLFFAAKIEAAARAVGANLLQAFEPGQFWALLAGFVPRSYWTSTAQSLTLWIW
jgi:hypothetical protein